jgi:hypothetical protein
MADTIVKSFVIDTSKAEQNLRSLDAASAATQASLDLLYNQLVQLDAQLNGLDPSSEAFANVNTQIQALETTISNIETGGIQNIGNAIDDIDTAKVKDVGDAIQSIDTGDAARNIENVGDAIEQVVAPVDQLSSATGQLNTELKDTKVDTSNLDAAASEYKDLAVTQEEVVTSSKSLKAQLRELQAQLAATDPDSAKYRELAQAAGELKDKIQDAAQAVGTQAGGAFERVGGSLGLVTSRIANLDFEGAAEGAKQLAANIGQVKPGDITKGIQGIGSALGSVGKALLTNPIFLIGAAIAAAIVYADELLSLIDGVTDAEQESLNVQKERAAVAKQNFDNISATEETLKRQGLTEEQITQLKITQLNTAIAEQQAVIETTRIQAEGQIKAAERNAQYLKTFLDFVTLPQRKIAEFFESFVNGSIGILNKLGLGIEKIDVTKVFDDVNNFIVKKIFDPEEERKNQEKIVADAEKSLTTLVNTRDGILNAQDAKEKSERDKANADRLSQEQKTNAAILESRKKLAEQSLELTKKIREDAAKPVESTKTEVKNFDEEIKAQRDAEERRISFMAEGVDKEIALADLKAKRLRDAAQGNADELKAIAAQNAADVAAIQEEAAQKEVAIRQASFKKGLDIAQSAISVLQAFSDASTKNSERDARKKFRTDKALAIGAATVQTASAVTGALTAGGNPIKLATGQQFFEASIAAALGLAQIVKIKNSQFGSTGGNDSSTPPPSVGGGGEGGGGNESQPAQFNPLASQFIQNQPEQITPRAFVLAGDVSSQQEVREKVQDLARLG